MVHTSDSSVENQQPIVKKSNRKWLFIGIGCAVLFACICLIIIGIGLVKWSGSVDSTANHSPAVQSDRQAVTAIAVKLDGGSPNLFLFVGNTQDPWMLPGGRYYIEAANELISVYTIGTVTIPESSADVNLGQRIATSTGKNLPQQKNDLMLIANAITGIQNGMLTYLFIFSDGYTAPLFTSRREITAYDLETLRNSYEPILANEEATISALLALETRANSAMGTSTCPFVCSPQQGLMDSILTFFSEMHHVDSRAVNDILQGSAAMTPQEKADAFQYMTSSMTGGALSFDDLIQKLENGELNDQANRIRNSLMDEPTFVEALIITRKGNRPLLDIAHEEGAVLVEKGAQMEVDIVKQVLQTAFPGIEKGFEYADKVNAWAEFIRTTYTDPAAGAAQFAGDQATSRIKDQLLTGLLDMGYGENQADEMAGYLSEQILGQLTKHHPELEELMEQEAEATDTPGEDLEPTATPAPFDITAGIWHGQSQWLCDNNVLWDITLDFNSNGIVTMTFSHTGQDTITNESTWELDGDAIRIDDEISPWLGTVDGKTMAGEFIKSREDYECSGIWYAEQE